MKPCNWHFLSLTLNRWLNRWLQAEIWCVVGCMVYRCISHLSAKITVVLQWSLLMHCFVLQLSVPSPKLFNYFWRTIRIPSFFAYSVVALLFFFTKAFGANIHIRIIRITLLWLVMPRKQGQLWHGLTTLILLDLERVGLSWVSCLLGVLGWWWWLMGRHCSGCDLRYTHGSESFYH